ncbi:hypothetical protein EYF80_006775 [Liparis tanakae]|uniref:Uncharacterized protein n=1 Tax=Liparis tanakae TaxID=230148 RepID=A0A4Z2IZ93_9TELE|nr:hypothetical protein EYF80_006775 [Liparis tanakae]
MCNSQVKCRLADSLIRNMEPHDAWRAGRARHARRFSSHVLIAQLETRQQTTIETRDVRRMQESLCCRREACLGNEAELGFLLGSLFSDGLTVYVKILSQQFGGETQQRSQRA